MKNIKPGYKFQRITQQFFSKPLRGIFRVSDVKTEFIGVIISVDKGFVNANKLAA